MKKIPQRRVSVRQFADLSLFPDPIPMTSFRHFQSFVVLALSPPGILSDFLQREKSESIPTGDKARTPIDWTGVCWRMLTYADVCWCMLTLCICALYVRWTCNSCKSTGSHTPMYTHIRMRDAHGHTLSPCDSRTHIHLHMYLHCAILHCASAWDAHAAIHIHFA